MREHDVNNLNNFICGWYTEEYTLCDRIIDYFNNDAVKSRGKVGTSNNSNIHVDTSIKDSTDCLLLDTALGQQYGQVLQRCVNEYIKKYPYCNEYGAWGVKEAIVIQHYNPGGGYYQWHTERTNRQPTNTHRHMVFMTYLNDVTDDGETEFFHQNIKIKPEKGLTLLWGSDWTFTHRGVSSLSQDKYILTGWFEYM